jgi:hypothetical protein
MRQDTLVTERWLPVVGYEKSYEVSDRGRVRSVTRNVTLRNGQIRHYKGRVLRAGVCPSGHLLVYLRTVEKSAPRLVHRLVLETFVGLRPPNMECCHGNGNPADNRLENLRWDTRSGNMFDTVRHGMHHQRNKKYCVRNHLLVLPNLVVRDYKSGRRSCLACQRAKGNVRSAVSRGEALDLRIEADRHYRNIMKESGRS